MDSKIIYLLGAGASVNALPLANDFADKLKKFSSDLNEIKHSSLPRGFGDSDIDPLIEDSRWLGEEGGKHASIDTLAKKLFFKKDHINLKKLKAVVSTFLIIEQAKNNVDYRYDSFLATILAEQNGSVILPDELEIITWNYDTQLDKAFFGFCDNEDYVIEKITLSDKITRLNGYCGTELSGHIGKYFLTIISGDPDSIISNGIELYNSYMRDNSYPDINFAWEDSTLTKFSNQDISSIETASSMVIIGYSFPYFNREIDSLLLSHFPSGLKPKKPIYLQLPEKDQKSVATRIKSLISPGLRDNVDIIPIIGTDQFYIPDEFWQ
jgi:hypothetical protein